MYYVKIPSETVCGSNRNITYDNWFIPISLAEEILKKIGLTLVGTMRKNKREIPPSFFPNKNKPVLSFQYAFDGKTTIVFFTPKKNKYVIFISTMHDQKDINEVTKKPEIIDFYNSTKGGVDIFDKMVHAYSVSRSTRRWPLRMLYGIFDQAGINASILYKLTNHHHQRRNNRYPV